MTFGGHPVSAAAALANLDVFEEEDLVGNSRRMGDYLYDELQRLWDYEIVGDIRGGLGLLGGCGVGAGPREQRRRSLRALDLANRLPPMLFDNGLVSFRAGDVISICPPLVVDKDEVDYIVDADRSIVVEVERRIGRGVNTAPCESGFLLCTVGYYLILFMHTQRRESVRRVVYLRATRRTRHRNFQISMTVGIDGTSMSLWSASSA